MWVASHVAGNGGTLGLGHIVVGAARRMQSSHRYGKTPATPMFSVNPWFSNCVTSWRLPPAFQAPPLFNCHTPTDRRLSGRDRQDERPACRIARRAPSFALARDPRRPRRVAIAARCPVLPHAVSAPAGQTAATHRTKMSLGTTSRPPRACIPLGAREHAKGGGP